MTTTDLPKQYTPADHEPRIWQRWLDANAFHADPGRVLRGEARPYAVVIPPPNVTGALHLGHALNNTIQDVLVRAHRMMGYETIWLPGTDHAGIATQTVVDKRLKSEGQPALVDYKKIEAEKGNGEGRNQFIAKVMAWKDEYEARITAQLQAMGCSCDWERQRFTMDDVCARAVREAFFRLFKDGLIYRGKRLVNWDPVTQTALADDEVEMHEVEGAFYDLRYPLVHPAADGEHHKPVTWGELAARGMPGAEAHPDDEQAWVTVATTRPETYLGDVAVAVNPRDPRAPALRGLRCRLPIVGRIIPILEDDYVVLPLAFGGPAGDAKAEMSTGFLKVTPAHDPNDYEIGRRHEDEIEQACSAGTWLINVMAPDATISADHGWTDINDAKIFLGKTREEARKLVIDEFKARTVAEGQEGSLLERTRPHRHSVGHSYRSHAVIEPYLSDQWYVRVTDDRLKGNALSAMAPDQRTTDSFRALQTLGGTGVPPVSTPPPPSQPKGIPQSLTIYHRHLPHWQLGGSTYFITFRLQQGELTLAERDQVLNACTHWHNERARVHMALVMPDHVHLLITPLQKSPGQWWPLEELLHSIKSYTAHELGKSRNTTGPIWQDENFDRIVRDEHEFREKWNYMVMNPLKAGLASHPGEYPFIRRCEASQEHGSDGRDARPTEHEEPAGDGQLRFHPDRYAKTFESWHENLRDWCISRQLWWGHRIPVWEILPSEKRYGIPYAHEDAVAYSRELSARLQALAEANGFTSDFAVRTFNEYQFFVTASTQAGAEFMDRMVQGLRVVQARANTPGAIEAELERQRLVTGGPAKAAVDDMVLEIKPQDPDVLDTWFSSALWPLSTLGWPEPDQSPQTKHLLDAFNPTSVLCTAREIITLWVSRMVMFNRYFRGAEIAEQQNNGTADRTAQPTSAAPSKSAAPSSAAPSSSSAPLPFRDVFIHAMIQDGEGRKMSKSLGNGVDPMDIIHSHGSDAMRFTLCHMTTQTQDVRMPVERDAATGKNTSPKFDLGRNFCNKLWNASRFTLSILHKSPEAADVSAASVRTLALADRWMLSRLAAGVRAAEDALAQYQFSAYATTLYDLLWRDFCDWYLEAIKPTVATSPQQRAVLRTTLDAICRLLHPVAPFITESIYERLREAPGGSIAGIELTPPRKGDTLCTAGWPITDDALIDPEADAAFERARALVAAIREVRAQHQVPPKRAITLHCAETPDAETVALVRTLANVETITPDAPSGASVAFSFEQREHKLSNLADAVDAGAERERLTKQLADLDKSIAALEGRLNNPGYAERAPAHLVEQSRAQLAQSKADRDAAQAALDALA